MRTGIVSALLAVALAAPAHAKLTVAATTPDLAALAREVGGDDVEVTSFVRGAQDPHFIEPRPSFIRVLSKADVFVRTGLALEIGWAPVLVDRARNSKIRPGGSGAVDASAWIPTRGALTGVVDRSMGDVHASGNPHYTLDPVAGLRVARGLSDRFAEIDPSHADAYRSRYAAFEAELMTALLGSELGAKASAAAAAAFDEQLDAWIDANGRERLAGWLGAMQPHRGKKVIADHDLWPYFAARFGIEVVDFLEPKPGITPTTRHLGEVVDRMKREGIRVILASAYFNPRYAQKVAEASGGVMVEMANQVESRDGVDDYRSMVDWNVTKLAGAL